MFCRSSGGFARHIAINYLAPRLTSQQEPPDGKNRIVPSVMLLRKSNREELMRNNVRSQRIHEEATCKPAKVITILIASSALHFDTLF